MGTGGLSRTTYALTAFLLITACGGIGVKKRETLVNNRPTGGSNARVAGEAKTGISQNPERAAVRRNPGNRNGSIEDYFKQWLNVPYQFGGNTFNGVDCSGLIHNFFADYYGMDVPRTTTALYYASREVPEGRQQPGDLVFFQNTYRPGISHVGVMLDKERFVHAGSSGVTITKLSDSYFKKRFAGFRRIEK